MLKRPAWRAGLTDYLKNTLAWEKADTARVQRMLGVVSQVSVVFAGAFLLVTFFLPSPEVAILAVLSSALFGAVTYVLNERGYVRTAATLFCTGFFVICIAISIVLGGAIGPGSTGFLVVVIYAGFFLGLKGSVPFAAASTAAVVLLYRLESTGRITPMPNTSAGHAVAIISYAAAIAAIVHAAIRTMRVSFELQKTAENELRQSQYDVRERAARLAILSHIGGEITAGSDLDQLLTRTVEMIAGTFACSNVAILMIEGYELVLRTASAPQIRDRAGEIRFQVGQDCVTGWVASHGRSRLVRDVRDEPLYVRVSQGETTLTELAIPLRVNDRVIGVLDAQQDRIDGFHQEDLDTLQTIADQLAVAVENSRLIEEVTRRADRLAAINRVAGAAGATLDLDDLLRRVHQEITRVVEADAFFVALYEEESEMLDFRVRVDEGQHEKALRRPVGSGLTHIVISRRAPLLVTDFQAQKDSLPSPNVWGSQRIPASWLGVPMVAGDRVVGVISVQSYRPDAYAEDTTQLLSTIADQVAIAVENARLYGAIRRELEERRRLERELLQAQKMEAIGRLAGGVAHDFNNLLTAIMGYSELLLMNADESTKTGLEEIKAAVERGSGLTNQLLAFSRKQITNPEILDLSSIVEGTQRMLQRLIGEDIELETQLSDDLMPVRMDRGQVVQILMNLAINARDAMPKGGRLILETSRPEIEEGRPENEGGYVRLTVSDTGVGIEPDVLEHLFEPFFTTKSEGTGLGLSTVHGIVNQAGGFVEVESEPSRGTTFIVYIPTIEEQLVGERDDVPQEPSIGGSETILVVEDEQLVRDLVCRILQRGGYEVLEASDAPTALALSDTYPKPVHLMLTDVVMPKGISGRDLAEQMAERRPDMQVLYASGYTENAMVLHGIRDESLAFIQKPFTPSDLLAKVRRILDQPSGDSPAPADSMAR